MTIKEGSHVPAATLNYLDADGIQSVDTNDLFAGKNVIVFALPGAFTPTCSSTHLPRYAELAKQFASEGIDDILCVSVNDAFTMSAWARDQHTGSVRLLADGNGDFTREMGMLVDKRDLGFGERSWRYSMLVRDGVIEKIFSEPKVPGDPFEVSDAETMLAYLNPSAKINSAVTVITRPGCPHCVRARKVLSELGHEYSELVLGKDLTTTTLQALTGATTVPQVFVDGTLIGGADDLEASEKAA